MSRAAATGMTLLLLVLLTALTAREGISQGHGKAKEGMKGMEHKAMKQGPVGRCMEPMGTRPQEPLKGKVTILKPQNGVVINSRTVKIEFDYPELGKAGNHLHLYLDGLCKNMIRSGKSYFLSGLSEGKHQVQLRIVTSEHFEVGPSASVEITVQRTTSGSKPR
ncbi:MAG: hypothetical protein ACE5JS_04650 [Nitrospinota bacterium]